MPRPELLALLAAVKENPNDLTPWLVLCDWLEEYGDESDRARAEYCRLCFDKLGKKTYASDWEKGERRRALFREWNEAWLGPIAATPDDHIPWWRRQIRRGLVAIESSPTSLFNLHDRGIDEQRWAWVEELNILGIAPTEAKALAACPLLRGPSIIRWQVAWVRRIGPAVVSALVESPHLAQVR